MPESLPNQFFRREIERYAHVDGETSKKPANDPDEFGKFIFHPECCARVKGRRQTVSLHSCSANDPLFVQLPIARKTQGQQTQKLTEDECGSCSIVYDDGETVAVDPEPSEDCLDHQIQDNMVLDNTLGGSLRDNFSHLNGKPAADIFNALEVQGELFVACRGKEIVVVVVGHTAIRIGFGLEAHCFWVPTSVYCDVVAGPMTKRGEKSKAFSIPPQHYSGPTEIQGQVSIQAAFSRPDWTLIFPDHNVMVVFHVMALRNMGSAADLEPTSKLWPYLWSKTHGPVFSLEPQQASHLLELWREDIIATNNNIPIFLAVKTNQHVFNGYGAQETCDALLTGYFHPCMPAVLICKSEALFQRFKDTLITYSMRCINIVKDGSLPYTSGRKPFRMNHDGHKRFMSTVIGYRRRRVFFDQDQLMKAHSLGLLNPDAIIQDDGIAIVKSGAAPLFSPQPHPILIAEKMRTDQKRMGLQNYKLVIPAGHNAESKVSLYTPFLAYGAEKWWPVLEWKRMDTDVLAQYNLTTLGPYSFQVFVAAGYTAKHVTKVSAGRRPQELDGNSHRKRPLAADIAKMETGVVKRCRKVTAVAENVDIEKGMVLRSQM